MHVSKKSGWTKFQSFKIAASVATLVLAASAAHAQVYFATGFDTGYTSNSAAATTPLSGQNGWVSNDQAVVSGTGTAQLVGQSDFVGSLGGPFNGTFAGALGGIYRTPAGSATVAAPDVVPSTNSGGVVSLYHPVTITPTRSTLALNVDFYFAKPAGTTFTQNDTFSFTLGTATANLVAINFNPSTTSAGTLSPLSATVGGTRSASGSAAITGGTNVASGTPTQSAISLNAQYHLTVTISGIGTSPTFLAVITGGNSFSFGGPLTGAIDATTITQAGVTWNLADKTATGTAYNNAGGNFLAFDNFSVAVPEPSTYAMMGLGFLGLAFVMRFRRQQA